MSRIPRHLFAQPVGLFQHQPFRWLLTAQLLATQNHWMDNLVRGWFVLQVTGSVTQLALVNVVKSLPLLALALPAGAIADRVDRRRILIATQAVISGSYLVLALLIATDFGALAGAYATALVAGFARAFQAPTRLALLPQTVPVERRQNAIALTGTTGTLAQALGPMIGGFLIPAVGFVGTFVVQATLAAFAFLATWRMRLYPTWSSDSVSPSDQDPANERMVASVIDGLRYVRRNPILLHLLVMALVPMLLGMPSQHLLPAIADAVLALGSEGTGVLLGAGGVGSLTVTLLLSLMPPLPRRGVGLLAASIIFGLSVTVLGTSTVFWLSILAAWLAGVSRGMYRTFNHTLLLAYTEPQYLGRVNSIYVLDRGLIPVGTLALGFAGDLVGPGVAVAAGGFACLVISAIVAGRSRLLRAA